METKKILLVDDDIDVINVLETILTHEGYSVSYASNQKDGYEKALQIKPDLAILDVMMTTQYEGFEMAKKLKSSPEFRNMPVIMLTSIEVLVTTRPDVQAIAREFRKDPDFKEMDVLLIKDVVSGKAGIDYKSEDGKSVWLPVDGFLAKPVDSKRILPEVKRLLNETLAEKA
ncbi:MAG TPA: response regulator [Bacteroidia bacterium]|nr:response regulator [Bacteroidia bacterium]HRS58890.1 response regulator [Bacteroidia bacterium]HRU67387.1 response regulator [Bacteroidia bacterium]